MNERYTIEIGGMELNIVTDEDEEYVVGLAKLIDTRINQMILSNKRCTKTEAALFCALDFLDDKMKSTLALEEAKKRVTELSVENQRLKKEADDKR